jgi:hypothetical protein
VTKKLSWIKDNIKFDFPLSNLQEKYLACSAQYKVLVGGRRVGKDELLAAEVLYEANQYVEAGCRSNIICLAPTKGQLDIFFQKLRRNIEYIPFLQQKVIKNIRGYPQVITLEAQNKSLIYLYGFSSPRGDRSPVCGTSGESIFLIEADYQSQGTYDFFVRPEIMTRPNIKIRACGSPNSDPGILKELYDNKYFIKTRLPTYIREDFNDFAHQLRRDLSKDQYKREISGLWLGK